MEIGKFPATGEQKIPTTVAINKQQTSVKDGVSLGEKRDSIPNPSKIQQTVNKGNFRSEVFEAAGIKYRRLMEAMEKEYASFPVDEESKSHYEKLKKECESTHRDGETEKQQLKFREFSAISTADYGGRLPIDMACEYGKLCVTSSRNKEQELRLGEINNAIYARAIAKMPFGDAVEFGKLSTIPPDKRTPGEFKRFGELSALIMDSHIGLGSGLLRI